MYQPDRLHRIRSVQPPGETPIAIEYTPAGRLRSQTFPNGAIATYDYDVAGRIETITHHQSGTEVSRFAYTYDRNGNRQDEIRTTPAGTHTTTYDYDRDDRLTGTEVTDPAGVVTKTTYTLDAVGNRLTELVTVDGVATANKTYTFDARHQLDQVSDTVANTTTTFAFDANGFQTGETTNGQTTTYRPNLQDRLATLTTPTGPPVHYAYDPDGLRIEKRTTAEATRYGYDGTSLRRETNVTNNPLATYDWHAGRVLRTQRAGLTSYAQHDALKSPIRWSRADGGEDAKASYDAWGNRSAQSGVPPPIGYTGYYADAESNQFYAQQRYYQPGLGRFNRVDPWMGDTLRPITLNKYLYGNVNPLIYTDPDGRVGILTDVRNWFDDIDKDLRAYARSTSTPLVSIEIGKTRGALALLSSPFRTANLASDGSAYLVPRAVAPSLVDQGRSEFGNSVDEFVPFAKEYAANPYLANARLTLGAGITAAETVNAAAHGDGGAVSDLYSAATQAVTPAGIATIAGKFSGFLRMATRASDQSRPLRVGEESLHLDDPAVVGRNSSAEDKLDVTDAVIVSGRNATQRASSYEEGVRKIYGAAPLSRRTYAASLNPSGIGRADNVAQIGEREIAIEAKYTDDWEKSPFNPNSKLPWAAAERSRMINQARNYSSVFDDIIYHTNSVDLANYYSRVLPDGVLPRFCGHFH